MDINEERKKIKEYEAKYHGLKDYMSSKKTCSSLPANENLLLSFELTDHDLTKFLNERREANKQGIKFAENEMEKEIEEIRFYLKNKQNVALFGYGSKFELLSRILDLEKQIHPCMAFFGFSGSISIKMIINELYKLLRILLKNNEEFKNDLKSTMKDQLQIIDKTLNNEEEYPSFKYIYIFFHNIDGKNLLEKNGLLHLSKIASLKKIIFIGSFDNVRFPVSLNSKILENFNFLFHNVNTFKLYEIELTLEENHLLNLEDKKKKGLKYILKSLSENQKQLLKLMAKSLIDSNGEGITPSELLDICINDALLNTESALKQNLVEIIDHNIVDEKINEKGKKIYTMNLSKEIMDQIANDKFEENID